MNFKGKILIVDDNIDLLDYLKDFFMIYNYERGFNELERKRLKCWEWKVQIADCRYRPLTQLYDYFNARKKIQNIADYYIHHKLSDEEVSKLKKLLPNTIIDY